MAIDTRAYNQDYEVNYKRGRDDTGHYLKLRLGESMWFVLRETQLAGFQKIIKWLLVEPAIAALTEHGPEFPLVAVALSAKTQSRRTLRAAGSEYTGAPDWQQKR